MELKIVDMVQADWGVVSAIYQEGIDGGNATFAPTPPESWEEWRLGKINACSLVAVEGDTILGWAALGPASKRWVYRGVGEVSIYVRESARGKGAGSRLLEALIERSEANGIWTLQARIFPENQASLRLHERHGFRVIGIQEKLGQMEFGQYEGKWRDVVFLERRSRVVGVE